MSVEEKISKIAYTWGLRVNGGVTVTKESKPSPKKNRNRELWRNGKKKMKTADLLKRVKFLKIFGISELYVAKISRCLGHRQLSLTYCRIRTRRMF